MKYQRSTKPIKLHNRTCPYCGRGFSPEAGIVRTKEHVIGRKFVPRGTLDGCWNLILWACDDCNGTKSQLEEHVSAITVQPDVFGRHPTSDELLAQEANRKGRGSISPVTGKQVLRSQERLSLHGTLAPGVRIKFDLTGQATLDPEAATLLARYQLQAFFYWITYDKENQCGRFWLGSFLCIGIVHRGDWGNIQIRGFSDLISDWVPRVRAIGMDEYFKLILNRKSDDLPLWGWAIEWNQSYRLFGFLGDEILAKEAVEALPQLAWQELAADGTSKLRLRKDIPLDDSEDHLFG